MLPDSFVVFRGYFLNIVSLFAILSAVVTVAHRWLGLRNLRGFMNSIPPGTGLRFKGRLLVGVAGLVTILFVLALARRSLFNQDMPTPTPPPVTVTPEEPPANSPPVQPQPTPTSPANVLGPASVTDTTYLHDPFAEEQCGTCHDLLNPGNPQQLWGPVVEVCRVCHWQVIDVEQPTHIHDPFPEGKCLTCHAPHASGEAFLFKAPQEQVCRECHEEPTEQPHPSVAPGECLLCHAGHGSEQQAILREPQATLCARCHADHTVENAAFGPHVEEARECTLCHKPHTGEFQDQAVVDGCRECHEDVMTAVQPVPHEPVTEGECLACHVFHQEEQFALLAKPQPAICRDCHELGEPVEQTHPDVALGECLLCHTGHGGEHMALLRKDERALCATCHEGQIAAVQTSVKPHFESGDLPLCDRCHNPHDGSQDPIEMTEGCAQCHADQAPPIPALRQASLSIHEPVREEGCVACHDFHKLEAGRPVVSVPVNDLCLECHADLPHEAHPVSGQPDPWHGGELSCNSCHSPHDTPFLANLLVSGDALCLQCHQFQQ